MPESEHSVSAPASLEDQAVALLQRTRQGEADFERALDLLARAIDTGSVIAQHILGDVYLQNPQIPDAARLAVDCYRQSAAAGLPESVYRLADCCLTGHGVPRDDQRAASMIEQLARQALPDAMIDLAYLKTVGLGVEANPVDASSWLLQAAAMGHTTALRLLCERYLHGNGVPRSAPLAVAWLELARLRGFVDADHRMAQLNSALEPAELREGQSIADMIRQGLKALPGKLTALAASSAPSLESQMQVAAENLRSIGLADIDVQASNRMHQMTEAPEAMMPATPPSFVERASSPRVLCAADFISDEENILLLASTEPLMKSTAEIRDASNHLEVDAFDGACAVLSANLTPPVVRHVMRRFSQAASVPEHQFEPASVLRYGPGDEYSPHVDFFDARRVAEHEAAGDHGGQRMITALIYLIEPEAGGQTHYPHAELTVACQRNTALMHFNAHADGTPDPLSLHASLPIEQGEKWLFRTSARQFSLYRSD